jgi:hypothetical protein
MGRSEAARYADVPVAYLMAQCRKGMGPKFIRPSPKKSLFRKQDLDEILDRLRKSAPRTARSGASTSPTFPLPDQNGPNPSSRFTSPAMIEILV